ncbi:MAG TPA: anthranilate synthase component I family protein [Sedimentisphaerales bacterium]|nr:anthranilate synthase component I family protein [Sedimentisphaerales bacterium]
MADDGLIPCRLHWRTVRAEAPLQALSETFAKRRSPSILGANPAVIDSSGLSYWAAEPREVFEFTAEQTNPFPQLQSILSRYRLAEGWADPHRTGLPSGMFTGGWIGYFSYELGRCIERLPERAVDDLHLPLIRLCFYDRFIAYDHRTDEFWVMALELPDDPEKPEDKIAALERLLHRSPHVCPEPPCRTTIEDADFPDLRRNLTRDEYMEAVKRIKDYIRDGDVYQVNFSHRLEAPFRGSPARLFHWQNRFNPSGYAAYVDAGGFQIVSASPERFVTIRDGLIQTKPIKGTRPRIDSSHPEASRINAERFHDLLVSEKDQAELNMIIDLERNDVARICKPGTRRVSQPRTIETCPTVYHGVAAVEGELRDGITFSDILKAMFPGGSVTGAPKIRAMEIIDELEPTARGVYTGTVGFLGLDGVVCLNIAIRTIIIAAGSAFVQSGGGIVADSDPQDEWEETRVKARALLAGIEAVETEYVQQGLSQR